MKLTKEHQATIHRIRHSKQKDFITLARIAGLNPKFDSQHANLSGIEFGCADLRGFDFTGADLRGADLQHASIDGAIFTDTDTMGTLWPEKRISVHPRVSLGINSSEIGSPYAGETTTMVEPALATGHKRVGKYFAAIVTTGGILFGVVLSIIILTQEIPYSVYIGQLYEEGRGVPRDYAKALRWYQKAADQGDTTAQIYIGQLYEEGRGVPRDYAKALRWYQKAADQGDTTALVNIGQLYETGRGVPRDYAEALRWYQKAADQGNTTALVNIGRLYNYGRGVPKDYAEALRWYQKAADQGDTTAQIYIGRLHEEEEEEVLEDQVAP